MSRFARELVASHEVLPELLAAGVHERFAVGWLRRAASALASVVPRSGRLFAERVVNPEDLLGINGRRVAFEKLGEDERPWQRHVES